MRHGALNALREGMVEGHTGIYCVKEVGALLLLFDVCVDEQGVGLGVDVLHHDLEAVEAARFRDLNFTAEALDEVLIDDTIRRGEEGEHVGDEIALVVVQAVVPVVEVLREVNLFGSPEGGLSLLVHLPDLELMHVNTSS